MLFQCHEEKWVRRVLDYIGDDYEKCFYLYIDLQEYGVCGDNEKLWVSLEGEAIRGVAYKYFDTLHLYSQKQFPIDDALMLERVVCPHCIYCSSVDVEEMSGGTEGTYMIEYHHIITADKFMEETAGAKVLQAREEDIPGISALMMKDKQYYTVYTYEKLCEQLKERFRTGFGRLFILRNEKGAVVAANAIYAETKEVGVVSGLITDLESRGKGLGRSITASTWNLLRREGKKGLALLGMDNTATIALHEKMGFTFLGTMARMIKTTE